MSKFRVSIKIQGLELEVEGTRDDVPALRKSLTQQLGGLFVPAMEIVDSVSSSQPPTDSTTVTEETNKRKRKPRATHSRSSGETREEKPVDWRHDTTKYGSPKQAWKTADKALWLLYVSAIEANVKELSGSQIVLTFNKHFRQAGQLKIWNVNRDLGRLKTSSQGQPPLVSEDTTKNPPTWFLTEAGIKAAQKLVGESLGQQPSSE